MLDRILLVLGGVSVLLIATSVWNVIDWIVWYERPDYKSSSTHVADAISVGLLLGGTATMVLVVTTIIWGYTRDREIPMVKIFVAGSVLASILLAAGVFLFVHELFFAGHYYSEFSFDRLSSALLRGALSTGLGGVTLLVLAMAWRQERKTLG